MADIESLLLDNLQESMKFDEILRKSNQLDRLSAKYLKAIMFEPNEAKRNASIEKIQADIVTYFEKQVQPEAVRVGATNAVKLLSELKAQGFKPDLNDAATRQRVLLDLKLKTSDRLAIVKHLMQDNANTLENRLSAYWIEPGSSEKTKLQTLIHLHTQMETARQNYERALVLHLDGKGPRPRKPNLDFLSKFTENAKQDLRVQARRSSTDAEHGVFEARGETVFSWVTVNASDACPDCRKRQGLTGSMKYFEEIGKPGAGSTLCGSSCFCVLVPAKTLNAEPKLGKGLNQKPAPKTTATAPAIEEKIETAKTPPAFPDSLKDLQDIRGLGGSTGARLVQDVHGQKFVLKKGGSPEHIREEFMAESAYRAAGVDVPDSKLYDDNTTKLSKFIEGRTFDKLGASERAAAYKKAQEGFAADAVLGNWDAAGQNLDNLLLGNDGKVWRIDVGGALRFRAQGAKKTEAQFSDYPVELFTLRSAKSATLQGVPVNDSMVKVMGGLSHFDMGAQIEKLFEKKVAVLKTLDKDLLSTVNNRFNEALHVAKRSAILKDDNFHEAHVAEFTRHAMNIRQQIGKDMPKELKQAYGPFGNIIVKDENGKDWDHLRGPGKSTIDTLAKYIASQGGDYKFVEEIFRHQASSSWASNAQALKVYIAKARQLDDKKLFWKEGFAQATTYYNNLLARYGGEEKFNASIIAYHSYNTELLGKTKFENNDTKTGHTFIMRTEIESILNANGIKLGDKNKTMKRGAAESCSIFRKVEIDGSALTVQQVPHHRVLGIFFNARNPGTESGLLYSDTENEFVCHLEGLDFDYVKNPPAVAPKAPNSYATATLNPAGKPIK